MEIKTLVEMEKHLQLPLRYKNPLQNWPLMEIILSIDPGWKLGWAVFYRDDILEHYGLLEHGVVNFQRNLGEAKRYKALWNHLLDLKLRHTLSIMLIEPAFGRFRSTRNGEICGIIKMSAYESNIPVKEMNVLSVRAKLKLKGTEGALAHARQWTGNEHLSTHEADAICQGLVYLKEKEK